MVEIDIFPEKLYMAWRTDMEQSSLDRCQCLDSGGATCII